MTHIMFSQKIWLQAKLTIVKAGRKEDTFSHSQIPTSTLTIEQTDGRTNPVHSHTHTRTYVHGQQNSAQLDTLETVTRKR